MSRHRAIIGPKFDMVDQILHEELDGWEIADWNKPEGGYFFNLKMAPHMAKSVWEKCMAAGVMITKAGSTFPYGNDPEDAYLRLAPTYPSVSDLEKAMHVIAVAIKLVYLENTNSKE